MAGPNNPITECKAKRIIALSKENPPLSTGVIGERLGIASPAVYQFQVRHGLRKVRNSKKS